MAKWTEERVQYLEKLLNKNMDWIRFKHNLPIPKREGENETKLTEEQILKKAEGED